MVTPYRRSLKSVEKITTLQIQNEFRLINMGLIYRLRLQTQSYSQSPDDARRKSIKVVN